MNLLFHSNGACFRGTSQSLIAYAKYARDVWKHNVYLTYDKNNHWNRTEAIKWWFDEFGENVITYENFNEVNEIIKNKNIDFCYQVKGGENDGKIPTGCRLGVHAVFRNNFFHGDVYAYISKWLSDVMTNGEKPYVDYPIIINQPCGDLREELGIPQQAIVLGRYGGNDQFNLPWMHQIVWQIVNTTPNYYFIFMNTDKFCPDHPQIKHLAATTDLQRKANFINTTDFGLNARDMGESAGMQIAEWLALDKAIFAWSGGGDQNHTRLINDHMYLYDDPDDFINKLNRATSGKFVEQPGYFSDKVKHLSLENIMENQFKPVFLGK